ncbi:MAG: CRISPR system precrRNA processing endoribonuclease RAMP protein Cas6 [Fibromonadales bacterium]|nr:CRISPR system precrRNA processing endoribonuclease RAMP protein Cas6 [Fibromonadales bacterium]
MLNLPHTTLTIPITLAKEAKLSLPLPFIFRSIIGFNLRKLVCIAKNAECKNCIYKENCVYATAFDEADVHPTIINAEPFLERKTENAKLIIMLLGEFSKYADYYVQALKENERFGVGKERIPYSVKSEEIRIAHGEWNFAEEPHSGNVSIALQTPLRFKAHGKYDCSFSELDFILCLHRRCQKLCSLYGKNNFEGKYTFENKWQNIERWSAKQKQAMPLGGITGNLTLQGEFNEYEIALFKFAELFNAGKNTNFGMGRLLSCQS